MNIATWIKVSAYVLAGVLLVLLLLTTLYSPAKKKAVEITVFAMSGFIVWGFLVVCFLW